MHSGKAGGYNHPKLFVSCNGSDHHPIASWAVHIKNHASDPVSLSLIMFLMSKDMSAVVVRACRPCCIVVLRNHRDDKSKAPDDKIRHVFITIGHNNYCSWTRSLAELSKNFAHL